MKNPTPTGTFNASALNYAGTSASTILSWLSGDSSSYVGTTDNLTDGVVQLAGTITTPVANTVIKASSEYGSYISIDGDNYIINTGTGTSIKTGTVTIPTAGTYPIFATYYNHTGSTAADLNLQWSTTTGLLYTAIPGNDLAPLNQRWMFNGSAIAYGNGVELMSNAMNQTGSAWLAVLEPANAFHASFDFYAPTAAGDGFTFAVQTYGTNSIGTGGLGLGYGGLVNSWALTFQFTNPVDYWNLMSGGTILTSDGITLSSYNINLAFLQSFPLHDDPIRNHLHRRANRRDHGRDRNRRRNRLYAFHLSWRHFRLRRVYGRHRIQCGEHRLHHEFPTMAPSPNNAWWVLESRLCVVTSCTKGRSARVLLKHVDHF